MHQHLPSPTSIMCCSPKCEKNVILSLLYTFLSSTSVYDRKFRNHWQACCNEHWQSAVMSVTEACGGLIFHYSMLQTSSGVCFIYRGFPNRQYPYLQRMSRLCCNGTEALRRHDSQDQRHCDTFSLDKVYKIQCDLATITAILFLAHLSRRFTR